MLAIYGAMSGKHSCFFHYTTYHHTAAYPTQINDHLKFTLALNLNLNHPCPRHDGNDDPTQNLQWFVEI